jgi:hypothetical protein
MKKIIFSALLMLAASTGLIDAQGSTPNIAARQAKQHARIVQGLKTRQLTKTQAAILVREQKRIQMEKRMAKSDGIVTPGERKFLNMELDRSGRDIYREEHGEQARGL